MGDWLLALILERDGLKADAERYRWLRSDDIEVLPGQREITVVMHRLPHTEDPDITLIESDLDDEIDARLAAKEQ